MKKNINNQDLRTVDIKTIDRKRKTASAPPMPRFDLKDSDFLQFAFYPFVSNCNAVRYFLNMFRCCKVFLKNIRVIVILMHIM